jgi:hypothetical protein
MKSSLSKTKQSRLHLRQTRSYRRQCPLLIKQTRFEIQSTRLSSKSCQLHLQSTHFERRQTQSSMKQSRSQFKQTRSSKRSSRFRLKQRRSRATERLAATANRIFFEAPSQRQPQHCAAAGKGRRVRARGRLGDHPFRRMPSAAGRAVSRATGPFGPREASRFRLGRVPDPNTL